MAIDYVTARLTRKQAEQAARAIEWYVGTVERCDEAVPVGIQNGIFYAHHALYSAYRSEGTLHDSVSRMYGFRAGGGARTVVRVLRAAGVAGERV